MPNHSQTIDIDLLDPDEWQGCIDDLRGFLDSLETGKEHDEPITRHRAEFIAKCAAENAVALYVHIMGGCAAPWLK